MKHKIELSEEFFYKEALPVIEENLPEIIPVLTAGLVGEGSECFGFDDEISADHDGEIRLFFWLDNEDYKAFAKPLADLLKTLPEEYKGIPTRLSDSYRSGIFETGSFYTMLCGFPKGPETDLDWLEVSDPMLAAATNGKVFTDNKGSFTEIRNHLLNDRPEDARLRRIAECMALAAQTGQYNYYRALKRDDRILQGIVKARFCENITSVVFLLNKRYKPFYKWSYRALKELPLLGAEAYELMDKILCEDRDGAAPFIEELCALVIKELKEQGIANEENNDDFLMDHVNDVLEKIENEKIRTRNISLIF